MNKEVLSSVLLQGGGYATARADPQHRTYRRSRRKHFCGFAVLCHFGPFQLQDSAMLRRLLRSKFLISVVFLLAMYAGFHFYTNRTVTWEEEVPLNTGETIWVERSMTWKLQSGYGNPFAWSVLPTGDQTLKFEYGGVKYKYADRAGVRWLAIGADKRPLLVARAGDLAWAKRNNYFCVTPYYVQFVPGQADGEWAWPAQIEPWLYKLPANLMAQFPKIHEERRSKYNIRDRDQRDATYRLQSPTGAHIDPLYTEAGCIHKYVSK